MNEADVDDTCQLERQFIYTLEINSDKPDRKVLQACMQRSWYHIYSSAHGMSREFKKSFDE